MVNIKIGSEYLDLFPNELIAWTIEDSELDNVISIAGLYTNSFNIPDTTNNKRLLNYSTNPLLSASAYTRIDASLLNDQTVLSVGYIRLREYREQQGEIEIEFLGSQTDLFESIGDTELSDLDFSDLDHVYSTGNVVSGMANTEGYVYTPINYGIFDFKTVSDGIDLGEIYPAIYLKDIVYRICRDSGFKIAGNALNTYEYNNAVLPYTGKFNKYAQSQNDARSYFAQGLYNASFATGNTKILTSQNVNQRLNGLGLYDLTLDRYTANGVYDINIFCKINYVTAITTTNLRVDIWKNGSFYTTDFLKDTVSFTDRTANGDYYEIYVNNSGALVSGTIIAQSKGVVSQQWVNGFTVEVSGLLPNMKQKDFLLYVATILGSKITINNITKTVFLNRIDSIKQNYLTARQWDSKLDSSKQIAVNFADVADNYAKKNNLLYLEDPNDFATDEYQKAYGYPYGNGSINLDNDFLESEGDLYEAPFAGTKNVDTFGADLLTLSKIPLYDAKSPVIPANITGLDQSFQVVTTDPAFDVAYIIIQDSSDTLYNGIWPVNQVSRFQFGVTGFVAGASATCNIIPLSEAKELEPRILIVAHDIPVTEINKTGQDDIDICGTVFTEIPYAYFHNDSTGETLLNYRESLSFSVPEDSTNGGFGIVDNHWQVLSAILQNPVLLRAYFTLKASDVLNFDFDTPVYLSKYQSYFKVIKIDSFDASGNSTLVEMVKL